MDGRWAGQFASSQCGPFSFEFCLAYSNHYDIRWSQESGNPPGNGTLLLVRFFRTKAPDGEGDGGAPALAAVGRTAAAEPGDQRPVRVLIHTHRGCERGEGRRLGWLGAPADGVYDTHHCNGLITMASSPKPSGSAARVQAEMERLRALSGAQQAAQAEQAARLKSTGSSGYGVL